MQAQSDSGVRARARTALSGAGGAFRPLREVFANPDLRRLELAWGGFYVGDWAHVVALSVYAYESGGVFAVGLVGLLRVLPSAFAVPFASLARRPLSAATRPHARARGARDRSRGRRGTDRD